MSSVSGMRFSPVDLGPVAAAEAGRRREAVHRRQLKHMGTTIEYCLPLGWKTKVASAFSMAHDCLMWTVWLDEPEMGWSHWFITPEPSTVMATARAYVDECMAGCVPDMASVGLHSVSCLCTQCLQRKQQEQDEWLAEHDNPCLPDTGQPQSWDGMVGLNALHHGAHPTTPRDDRPSCPVCRGDEGAVMHVDCVLR